MKTHLRSIPQWMSAYSNVPAGALHRINITLKVKSSKLSYRAFISHLRSSVSTMQCKMIKWDPSLCCPVSIPDLRFYQKRWGEISVGGKIHPFVSLRFFFFESWLTTNIGHLRLWGASASNLRDFPTLLRPTSIDWTTTIYGCQTALSILSFCESCAGVLLLI